MPNIVSYQKHIASSGEMFDKLALDYYSDERMAHHIMQANPDLIDTIIFEGGEVLKIPVFDTLESKETLPPWRQ